MFESPRARQQTNYADSFGVFVTSFYNMPMASSNDYLAFIYDLLREVDGISSKKMMGEYLLYKDGILFGGIYDNRFLVKKTASSSLLGLSEQIPYPGAKPMLLVDSESPREIASIVLNLVKDLAH